MLVGLSAPCLRLALQPGVCQFLQGSRAGLSGFGQARTLPVGPYGSKLQVLPLNVSVCAPVSPICTHMCLSTCALRHVIYICLSVCLSVTCRFSVLSICISACAQSSTAGLLQLCTDLSRAGVCCLLSPR